MKIVLLLAFVAGALAHVPTFQDMCTHVQCDHWRNVQKINCRCDREASEVVCDAEPRDGHISAWKCVDDEVAPPPLEPTPVVDIDPVSESSESHESDSESESESVLGGDSHDYKHHGGQGPPNQAGHGAPPPHHGPPGPPGPPPQVPSSELSADGSSDSDSDSHSGSHSHEKTDSDESSEDEASTGWIVGVIVGTVVFMLTMCCLCTVSLGMFKQAFCRRECRQASVNSYNEMDRV